MQPKSPKNNSESIDKKWFNIKKVRELEINAKDNQSKFSCFFTLRFVI